MKSGHSPLRLVRLHSDEQPELATELHARLIAKVMQTDQRVNIFNYDAAMLKKNGALSVVLAEELEGEFHPRAALHSVQQGDGTFYVGGAVTHPEFQGKGLMTRLLGHEMLRLSAEHGTDSMFSLDVRMINGVPTAVANKVYERLAFRNLGRPIRVSISGSKLDIHQFEFADPDGVSFHSQKMRTWPGWQAEVRHVMEHLGESHDV